MELIAGRVKATEVMSRLAKSRPVFHSEADFQFAFAQTVATLDPTIQVRLEVPERNPDTGRAEYIDIVCSAERRTRIELKYPTRKWIGVDGVSDDEFQLRDHAAMDLARLGFIHDVTRLERLTTDANSDGLAIILTNSGNLWSPTTRPTRDAAFRLDQGRRLGGNLEWGTSDAPYVKNNRTLAGSYVADWQPYSELEGCQFRWLGWSIATPTQ